VCKKIDYKFPTVWEKSQKTAGEGVIFDSHCRGMVLSYGENFIP